MAETTRHNPASTAPRGGTAPRSVSWSCSSRPTATARSAPPRERWASPSPAHRRACGGSRSTWGSSSWPARRAAPA
ncbi:hypothetical protein NKG05_02910 [Oerskovia sp. M15]